MNTDSDLNLDEAPACRSAVQVVDGYLVISPEQPVAWSTALLRRDAFDSFLRLGQPTETLDSIRSFAETYGPLGRGQSGVGMLRAFATPPAALQDARDDATYVEPVALWRSLSIEFNFLAAKHSQLRVGPNRTNDDLDLIDYVRQAQREWDESSERLRRVPKRTRGFVSYPRPEPATIDEDEDDLDDLADEVARTRENLSWGTRVPRLLSSETYLSREREHLAYHINELLDLAPRFARVECKFGEGDAFGLSGTTSGTGLFSELVDELRQLVLSTGRDYYRCCVCHRTFVFARLGPDGKRKRRPRNPIAAHCIDCQGTKEARRLATERWRLRLQRS